MTETIRVEIAGGVARLTLNRPEAHNAMSDAMITEILEAVSALQDNRTVRVLVIAAEGDTFCAGGDLRDMQAQSTQSDDARLAAMARFDAMLRAVNEAPQVTIARVHGPAMGGGFGLVCVADIVIAGPRARFGLPEVRLGVAPAMISPYVIARVGLARARHLMLTGIRFDGQQAVAYGVAHETAEDLDGRVKAVVDEVLQGAPHALAETKRLIFAVSGRTPDETLAYRAALITRLRSGEEGQEGMMAFLEKRKPSWAP